EEVTSTRRGKGKTNAREGKKPVEQARTPVAKGKKAAATKPAGKSAGGSQTPKTDEPARNKPSRSGARARGGRSDNKSSASHGKQSNKKAQNPPKTGTVRSAQAAPADKSESLFSAAATGFKKTLARFKKKR